MSNSNYGKVVKFTNITDKDFSHAFGGQPYFVKARDTVMLPYELADHLATHLARRIFLDNDTSPTQWTEGADRTGGMGRPLWNEESEANMKAKILGEVFESQSPAPKSELDLLREKVEQLATQFGLTNPTNAPVDVPAKPIVAQPNNVAAAEVKADEVVVPESQKPELTYKDKAEIMEALKSKGVSFDARQGKSKLEQLLASQGIK